MKKNPQLHSPTSLWKRVLNYSLSTKSLMFFSHFIWATYIWSIGMYFQYSALLERYIWMVLVVFQVCHLLFKCQILVENRNASKPPQGLFTLKGCLHVTSAFASMSNVMNGIHDTKCKCSRLTCVLACHAENGSDTHSVHLCFHPLNPKGDVDADANANVTCKPSFNVWVCITSVF